MADEALLKSGLFFDDLNKVRVIDPEITNQTTDLRDECKDFVERIKEFQNLVGQFIQITDAAHKRVEEEKTKAIGAKNVLKSMARQREAEQQALLSLIAERKQHLERLTVEYESLRKAETEQNNFIEQFMLQK